MRQLWSRTLTAVLVLALLFSTVDAVRNQPSIDLLQSGLVRQYEDRPKDCPPWSALY